MKRIIEKTFCDICMQEYSPDNSKYLPNSVNESGKNSKIVLPAPVMEEDFVYDGKHQRFSYITIHDICDSCLAKLIKIGSDIVNEEGEFVSRE